MRRPAASLAPAVCGMLLCLAVTARGATMLSGRVQLAEHAPLPAGAVLEVALVDLSALDEDDHLLGSVRMDAAGPSLVRVALPYEPAGLKRSHQYVLRAVVRASGQVLQAGELPTPAGRRPADGWVLVLHAAEPPAEPTAVALPGTEWRVVAVDGQPLVVGHDATLAFADAGRVSGSTGCNRLHGHYESLDATLRIEGVATTRMACLPELGTQESRVLAALAAVASAHAAGPEELVLKDAAGAVRLRLSAAHGR